MCSFPHLSPISALTYWAEILHLTLSYCTTDQVRVPSICVNFCRSFAPFGIYNTENTQFSTLFSYTLWHIDLKFCISLCVTVLQIKFECCQLPSNFVGVMPLLDLEYWKIHSFPHFSFTCFDISGWNFTYDFVLLYYRSSSSVVNFRHSFMELYPFRNVEYWKFSFPHFPLTCFDILSWYFAYDFVLMYYRLSLSFLNLRWFFRSYAPFGNQNTGNTKFSALFSYVLWHIELKLYIWLCLMYKRSSSSVITLCLSGTPSVHPFSAFSSYIHRHI